MCFIRKVDPATFSFLSKLGVESSSSIFLSEETELISKASKVEK
jgi:hypothetical protein